MEKIVAAFKTDDQASQVGQPTDRAFDFPATFIASQFAAELGFVRFWRCKNQFDHLAFQAVMQPGAVGREVVQQALQLAANNSVAICGSISVTSAGFERITNAATGRP